MKAIPVLTAFLLTAALSFPASALCAPRMALSMDVWDFGEIYQWTDPTVTITIENKGDETLKVTDVKSSCGCTPAFLSEREIPPGGTGRLKIDFASYLETGRIKKVVKLWTNDPAAREKTIPVIGFIRADKAAVGSLEPDYVDLGVVAPYETRYFEVLINNAGNADLEVGDIVLPDGYFLDSAMPKKAGPRSGVPFRMGYRPAKPRGPIADTVEVVERGGKRLALKVAGYVSEASTGADALVVTPTGFSVAPGSTKPVSISIKNGGLSPVAVEDVDSSLDIKGAGIDASELGPGDTGSVSVTFEPGAARPGTKGYIYIRLGIPVSVEDGH